jgi:uncharacterized protein
MRTPSAAVGVRHGAAAGRGLIHVYRLTLSPLIGFHCRHLPTCSAYADEAIGNSAWAGGWMTLARMLRSQPLGSAGLLPRNAELAAWLERQACG